MNHIEIAKRVFSIEAEAIASLGDMLNEDFERVVSLILGSSGRVVVCGMGKSGIIGKKISATLACTGTRSFWMHPGEAYHGDLGMVDSDDVFIALSYSGETDEVLKLLAFLRDNGNPIVAMTGRSESTLARNAHYHLNVHVRKEACPLELAPTSSATATLVMGDALAVALMEARGFQPENFARFHPGGSLGRRLLCKVRDEMLSDNLPVLDVDSKAEKVIGVMTKVGIGAAIVLENDKLKGIITDGDLRRAMNNAQAEFFSLKASDMMTVNPVVVGPDTSMVDAIELMNHKKVHALIVCDGDSLVGIVKR